MLVKLAYTVLGTNRMPGKQSVSDSRRHCGAFRTLFRVSACGPAPSASSGNFLEMQNLCPQS